MKKLSAIVLIIILLLTLSSCSLGNRIIFDDSDKKADERLEQILKAIGNKDKKGLKAMFSKKALAQAKDIDGGIDYVFDLFQGKVTSWDNNNGGPNIDESDEYGHIIKKFTSFYNVNTNKQKYIVFMIEYVTDTDHPDNVGLYTLRVIKAEDEKTQLGYAEDMEIPGVYKPSGIDI